MTPIPSSILSLTMIPTLSSIPISSQLAVPIPSLLVIPSLSRVMIQTPMPRLITTTITTTMPSLSPSPIVIEYIGRTMPDLLIPMSFRPFLVNSV